MAALTYHEHRAAAVESPSISGLPDILDVVCIYANEALQIRERAFDGLRVSFQRCFAPPDNAIRGLYPDKEPSRRHTKRLHHDDQRKEYVGSLTVSAKALLHLAESKDLTSILAMGLAARLIMDVGNVIASRLEY